ASFGMQYLATPWGGMPEPEELPANSRSLLTGVSALAVPTADYGNIERLIAWSAKVSAVPLEVRGKTKVKTSQFSFDLYVLGEQRVGTTKLPLDALQPQPGSALSDRGEEKMLVAWAQQWNF